MKKLIEAYLLLPLLFLAGCHESVDYPQDYYGNFDCLADAVDQHYCFFEEKGVDWTQVREKYRKRIVKDINNEEFFNLCAEMLGELRDGHVNLASPFDVSYYRKWWSDYPQDFDLRTLQQYYLGFDYKTSCGVCYKILPQNVGYIYYPSFAYTLGEGNLDYILMYLQGCDGLIIDIRDNGGGELENIHTFVGRFIHETMIGGYMRHKTGPGHSDFSEPYPMEYKPCASTHLVWDKPIAVLTNRSCFSSANDFVSVMKLLPNVRIVGAKTGGGGGLPFTYEMPNGWTVRLSTSPITDVYGNSIEPGIDPSPGCEVHCTAEALAAGRDDILDFAISLLAN